MQGFNQFLFETFFSANTLEDVIQTLPEAERVPEVEGTVGPEFSIITPNVVREARLHFGCPDMDKALLDDNVFGDRLPEFWSMRHFNVRSSPPPPSVPPIAPLTCLHPSTVLSGQRCWAIVLAH